MGVSRDLVRDGYVGGANLGKEEPVVRQADVLEETLVVFIKLAPIQTCKELSLQEKYIS